MRGHNSGVVLVYSPTSLAAGNSIIGATVGGTIFLLASRGVSFLHVVTELSPAAIFGKFGSSPQNKTKKKTKGKENWISNFAAEVLHAGFDVEHCCQLLLKNNARVSCVFV